MAGQGRGSSRGPLPGSGRSAQRYHDPVLGADLSLRIRELTAEAGATLDRENDAAGLHLTGAGGARQVLSGLWDAVLSEMLRAAGHGNDPVRIGELTTLLSRIRDAETAVAEARIAQGSENLRRVRAALAAVGNAGSVDDLLGRAPEAACSLGFDRALLSTVDEGTWRLHTMCVLRDPRWAEEIVAVGREHPPALDPTIVENDVVQQADSGLVFAVQDNPRVDRHLKVVTRSTSYGIAPLTVHGEVVGLVHGDCYHQRREVDATDRALLSLFAEGISHTLGRVSVLDGLTAVHQHLDRLTTGRVAPAPRTAPAPPSEDHPVLTRREVEIVRLLAAGKSNRAIGRRLVISEGTVKSHVTHILQKLGAANRAEAVSLWLRRDRAERATVSAP